MRPFTVGSGWWRWHGAPDYKNAVLEYYQRQLYRQGITSRYHLKLLVAQLVQENGSLVANSTHGDKGCSVGIPQRYVCDPYWPHIDAAYWLQLNPSWYDYRVQVDWQVQRVVYNYQNFEGDIRRTIIAHNCPACAAANGDRYMCVMNRTEFLAMKELTVEGCESQGGRVSRYYEDEVLSKVALLVAE